MARARTDARATRRSSRCARCTGAIIAIELVLCSVFVPVAFLGGIAGKLYQQFAVTVATAVDDLRRRRADADAGAVRAAAEAAAHRVAAVPAVQPRLRVADQPATCAACASRSRGTFVSLLLFGVVVAACVLLFRVVPSGFVPPRTRATSSARSCCPTARRCSAPAPSATRCSATIAQNPAIEHVFVVTGFDLIGGGNKTNAATMFIPLKPWEERKQTRRAVHASSCWPRASTVPEGIVARVQPAADPRPRHRRRLRGLRAGSQRPAIRARSPTQLNRFTEELRKRPELVGHHTFFRPTVPQLFVDVDREKALALGVPVNDDLRRAAGDDGPAVRQRLQPVRPHVSACSCRPTRRIARSPRTSATSTCARRRPAR